MADQTGTEEFSIEHMLNCGDLDCKCRGVDLEQSQDDATKDIEPWEESFLPADIKALRSAVVIAYSTMHSTSLQAGLMGQQALSDVAHAAAQRLDGLINQLDKVIRSGNGLYMAPF